jgi:hypothetical protein
MARGADFGDEPPLERVLPAPAPRSSAKQWFESGDEKATSRPSRQPQPGDEFLRTLKPVPSRPGIENSPAETPVDDVSSPVDSILHGVNPGDAAGQPRSNNSKIGNSAKSTTAARLGQLSQQPVVEPDAATAEADKRNYNDVSLRLVLPYADYQPNGGDPCLSQCPRPEDCKDPDQERGFTECPPIVQLSDSPYEGRLFGEELLCWEAPNLWYNPLYFEDAPLERYGHYYGCLLQPFVSAGKFSAHLLALPYQMSIDPICSRRYSLGYYRPGECAPKLCYQPPLNADAAAATAAFYTGMFYIFP